MSLCASVYRDLWSPAGKGLTSWLSFVVSNCEFDTFPLVSWVIVSIPDLCTLTYFGPSIYWLSKQKIRNIKHTKNPFEKQPNNITILYLGP